MNIQPIPTATENRAGRLPVVGHNGDTYFIDFRLQEIRPADAPHRVTPFTEIECEALKERIRGIRAEFWGLYWMAGLDD